MSFLPIDYKLEKVWKEVTEPFDHPDFSTHANYLHFMSENSRELKLTCDLNVRSRIALDKKVNQKIKLLELTLENLKEEKKNIEKYPEYAIVCVSWVPVKSYYLIFNLLTLLEYLVTASDTYLIISHTALFNKFRSLISEGKVVFSKDIFNKICTIEEANDWKIPRWENVKRVDANPTIRYRQIIRKLSQYSKDEFKRLHKIKRLRGKKKKEFEAKAKINLCEFFYWYRIKANYRDMEFVDKGVDVRDFNNFYDDYFKLSMNFYSAFKTCINDLTVKRTGKQLLN